MTIRQRLRWYARKLRRVDRPRVFTVADRRIVIHHRGEIAHLNAIDQVFTQRQYEIPAIGANMHAAAHAHYAAIVAAGGVPLIIDAGANIGASALWLAATYPAALIVAVEPAADNLALLRQNCATRQYDIHAAAIGPADGETMLTNIAAGADGYQTRDDAPDGTPVPVISIATLLHAHPTAEPFLLKVDIEGAEKALFSGDGAMLDRFPIIAMEPHDWMLPGQRTALPFFRFHVEHERDFGYQGENIFSFSAAIITGRLEPRR